MSPELQDKLIKQFPELFNDRDAKTPFNAWGFEFDDGWYNLTVELLTELSQYIAKNKVKDFYILQLKEKFSTLRCYVGGIEKDEDFKAIREIISKYEKKSSETCEACGNPGKILAKGYWMKTLCPEDAAKLGYLEPTYV